MAQARDRWDQLEARVLRFCRRLYLAMAAFGTLSVVGGGVATVIGLVTGIPSLASHTSEAPAVPAAPAQRSLALSDVEQLRSTRPELFDLAKVTASSLQTELSQAQLDAANVIRDLFPSPPYTWNDVTQSEGIVTPGTARLIASVAGDFPRVNAGALFNGVRPVLSSAKVEQRAELLRPACVAFLDAVREHGRAIEERSNATDERSRAIDEQNAKFDADAQVSRERTGNLVLLGVYGMVYGVSAILLSGLFLAFLAVERHLRAIRERQPDA